MIYSIVITTNEGIRFEKVGDIISVTCPVGGYRKLGEKDEYYYYTTLIDVSDEQKLKFENRVREIIREVEILGGKINGLEIK